MSLYDLRTTNIVQPIMNTTTQGLRSFSYLGSRLWNNLVNDFPFLCYVDYNGFKEFIKDWTGPNLDDDFNYVQHYLNILLFIKYLYVILRVLNLLQFFFYLLCIGISYCISCYIPFYCIYSACTGHILHPLSYTSLLANVVCFTYDFKKKLFYSILFYSSVLGSTCRDGPQPGQYGSYGGSIGPIMTQFCFTNACQLGNYVIPKYNFGIHSQSNVLPKFGIDESYLNQR